MTKKVIVVGGGDSGKAAAFAARNSPDKPDVILIEKKNIVFEELKTIPNSEVIEVLSEDNMVRMRSKHGPLVLKYNSLIIATGSRPYIPLPSGKRGIFHISFIQMKELITAKYVIFYGLGVQGLSLLVQLHDKNIEVIEPEGEILPGILDDPLALKVREYLSKKGVNFFLGEKIETVYGYERASGIEIRSGFRPADAIIVDLGTLPRSELLSNITALGPHGGILTDEYQRTHIDGIYACGSCAEVKDASLEINRPIPTLDVSYKSGMIAGYNAGGMRLKTIGYVKKAILDLPNLKIISVGVTEVEAKNYDIPYYIVEEDHEGSIARLILEKGTGRIIGVQIIGPGSAELAEWAALAIRNHMTALELISHHFGPLTPATKALSKALDEAIR